MVRKVTFQFHPVAVGKAAYEPQSNQAEPATARSGVFRIFDVNGNLILLDKTHNLSKRLERFYGDAARRDAKSAPSPSMDLGRITDRVEFCPTDSPMESLYLLCRERRRWFPETYMKMRTFQRFHLLKINRRQRFPRLYATRQLKSGVDYFGPFRTRSELDRMKATLERTFKIRPCSYNIRGSDPYPDCLYFQTHGCSRPCNDDIGRASYMKDVEAAIAFVLGREEELLRSMFRQMQALAADTRFEEAEGLRRKLERIHRSRKENPRTYFDLAGFDFVVIMKTRSVKKRKVAIVRSACIAEFEEHAVDDIGDTVLETIRSHGDATRHRTEHRYDDFCIVSTFLIKPVKSVRLVPLGSDPEDAVRSVIESVN